MANRTFEQFQLSLERKVVKLFAKITYAGGAPVLVTSEILNASTSPITINPSQGIQSLTVDGTGQFTLVLGANNGGVPTYDPYVRLLSATATEITTAGDAAVNALLMFSVVADNVNGASGNPSISFLTQPFNAGVPGAGSLTDGSTLLLEITLSNTSAY